MKYLRFIVIVTGFFIVLFSINITDAAGSLGASCSSGATCDTGLVCIDFVCSRPRGEKEEGESCFGAECVAGLECRNAVCVKENPQANDSQITFPEAGNTNQNTGNTNNGSQSSGNNGQNPTAGESSFQTNQGQEGSGGLLKCGYSRDCTLCDMFILIRDIFNFLLSILGGVGVLSIVIGGIYMIISSGNPQMYQQGISIITNAVIGLVLAASSFLIFGFGLQALGFQEQNFAAAFTFQSGQFFEVRCDNASNFNDRGGWGTGWSGFGIEGSSNGAGNPGNAGNVSCQNNSCLANNPGLKEAIENNKYNLDSNILLALIDAGEGCNPAIRETCNKEGFAHDDCSCGFSQCTPRWRADITGNTNPQENCNMIRSNLQMDIDCAAMVVHKTNELGDAQGRTNACTDVRSIAACYNTGSSTGCAQSTKDYCGRIENFVNSC